MRNKGLHFLSIIIFWALPSLVFSQQRSKRVVEKQIVAPDTVLNTKPLLSAEMDSLLLSRQDSIPLSDTTNVVPRGEIQTEINYYGEDSIITDFTVNKVYLHKEAWFEYGNIRLEADLIIIDWEKSELFASGVTDSLGSITGNPIFKEGNTTYEIRKEMRYNFKTQKAIIKDVVTEQQDGLLRGETIKKGQDGSIYMDHGYYTTCNLEEPHWHISAAKIKSIRGKKVVTGPFNLYFNDIPTPIGLPFGMIPDTPDEKASGIVFPSYGQEQVRGLVLRDFGYYFAFNDFVHTRLTGDVYSKGGYGVKAATIYKKRYRYNGGFNVDFQKFKSPETELNPLDYNTFWVNWQHTPESRGNSRFSASVNAGTTNYNNVVINPTSFVNNVRSEFASNIAYSKTFTGTPFSMSANLRHSQNVQTNEVNLILPDIAINMNRQNPFQNVKFEPLKTLNIAWNFNLQNSINNRITAPFGVQNEVLQIGQNINTQQDILPFTLANLPQLLKDANNGAKNTIPLSSNFTLFKYFTGTASVNYTELWYTEKINFYFNPAENRVDRILESGFNRVGFYSSSFALNTNVYGFYNFKKNKKIEAIRHHMNPSFGFTYTPDFSNPAFGYYQQVQVDSSGRSQVFSRHQGFIFGGAPLGESRSLSINVRNVLEAKIKTESDTAALSTKKIPLLQTLNFSTNYNFAADSFQLAPINFNTRTSFFDNKLSVNLSTTLDPYSEISTTNPETGRVTTRRLNQLAWKNGQGIGRLRNANLNLNGSINPSNSTRGPGEVRDDITNDFLQQGGQMNEFVENEISRIVADPSQYIDWDIPWNLSFGYNISYNRQSTGVSNITQAINMSGDLSLSEKWKINFNAGFDFSTAQITQTMIGIARDLHCWQMNVNWIPFGRFTSYNVDIRVKSAILQDLKVSRRRSFFDR
ncbi:putative LPS assembly protein LptD [Rhodonellum sp.]|uniref:putative LPS assembly protein LptD n=1 Tax=Rhodonellum sp. TaxID=2231180 RepID=UPI0027263888|nr:putative LPS assembly protein LptD [Rhodonellum sp.]MDO9554579.1 putative LPS assembly protein LptD [Rhodonellum sp.]